MTYKTIFIALCIWWMFSFPANAQLSAQKDAAYFATIKAVANYKIEDEENIQHMQELREDEKFNKKLQKMMEKLKNTKSKDNINRRIYNILRSAGKQIYDELS